MKILVLHDPYLPIQSGSIGGEDNIAKLELEVLSNLGHDVIDGRFYDSKVNRKLNQIRAQAYGSAPDVLELINRTKPDVIHTHNLNQRSGYRWMINTDVPIVSSLHNFRYFCASSIAWRSGEKCFECRDHSPVRGLVHGCDGIRGAVNVSRQLIFQRDLPQVRIPRIHIVTSLMMKETMLPILEEEKLRLLRSPGFLSIIRNSLPRTGWLFAGRLTQEKGILDLIRIWPDNEVLDIAGDGPLKDHILDLIVNIPNINLIGTYPPGDVSIFAKYEGLVFPSTWSEGSPLVVMDSLGTGTPVITSEISSASEQVKLSEAGFVVKGNFNNENLMSAIAFIRKYNSQLSKNALKSIVTHFSLKRWGSDLEAFLQEAVELKLN